MIKVTGLDRVTAMVAGKTQGLRESSTPEGRAKSHTEKHAHLLCPDHGGRPKYAVKPEDGEVAGSYCCAKLREMAKEEGFNPL
jgi:hypothetical protein